MLDGGNWRVMDVDVLDVLDAQALAIYNGSLIAAARIKSGANSFCAVVRWDGNGWEMLGGGLGSASGDVVNSLIVYQGQLFAGGKFSQFVNTEYVARWDGTTWQPIGPSIP